MFDIGGWELFLIGAVALIVVGPKDLPRLVRNVGKWVGKARALARDFQTGMEDAAREADLQDVAKTARSVSNPGRAVREAATDFKKSVEADAGLGGAPAGARPTAAKSSRPARDGEDAGRSDDAVLADFQRGVRKTADKGR